MFHLAWQPTSAVTGASSTLGLGTDQSPLWVSLRWPALGNYGNPTSLAPPPAGHRALAQPSALYLTLQSLLRLWAQGPPVPAAFSLGCFRYCCCHHGCQLSCLLAMVLVRVMGGLEIWVSLGLSPCHATQFCSP